MEWSGQGVIVGVRRFGETSAIIDVFTQEKGRHAGVVRGGSSRKMAPLLQPGAQVALEWRARLEEHLGNFHVEPLQSRSMIMSDRMGLSGLGAVCSLIQFAFPERMVLPELYARTIDLLDRIDGRVLWAAAYAHWEMLLLEDLGYGMDLSCCAVTGMTQELVFVSPKSGRAVSRDGAGEWADRLLALPDFLRNGFDSDDKQEILNALRLTGYFLQNSLAPALGNRPIPDARARLIAALEKRL
ncbi:DNA repair protein RecO [Amylibacter ulvae]|uniref:DNA repair protein RecO n=1 Tax=Paramylibacter ulvae TaxID=1651968 RepID=A0ABQ3D9M9_9RHOB|nr:DNA repair protein RecO [Amylibacter ulvae]GHA56766.1 DNA repair protein RecO [Amylibacter ulvae]